jgi:tetratricopeptide (TPR) repeat protein
MKNFQKFPNSLKHLLLYPLTEEISELERFLSFFNGYQTGLRFLALVGKSEYLHSKNYSLKISRAISELGRPSLGHWLNFIREYTEFCSTITPSPFSYPVSEFFKKSILIKYKSPLVDDANKSLVLNDYFVYLRNKWIGHGILPDSEEAVKRNQSLRIAYQSYLDIFPEFTEFEFETKEGHILLKTEDSQLTIEPLVIQEDYFISYYDGFDGIKMFYIASKSGSSPRVEKEKVKEYKKLLLDKEKLGKESLDTLPPVLRSLHSANTSLNNILNKLIVEGKYLPSIGTSRKIIENDVKQFMESSESIFLLSGKTGNGKTFFLSVTAENYRLSNCVLFLRGHELTGENLIEKIGEILSNKDTVKALLEIASSMEETGNFILIILDAINESNEMGKVMNAVLNLLNKINTKIKIIISIKDSSLQSLLLEESLGKTPDSNLFFYNKDEPYFTLLNLTDEESSSILELRKMNGESCPDTNYLELPTHIREIIKNPFTLKIFCDLFDKAKITHGVHFQDILNEYIEKKIPKEVKTNVKHRNFLLSIAEIMIHEEKSYLTIDTIYSELGQKFSELEFHESIRVLLENGLITEERIQKRRGFTTNLRFFHDKLRDTFLADHWLDKEIDEEKIIDKWNSIQSKDLIIGPIEIYFFESIVELDLKQLEPFILFISEEMVDFPFSGLLEKFTLFENKKSTINFIELFINSISKIKNENSILNMYYSFENAIKMLYLQGYLRRTISVFQKILHVDWKNEKSLWWYLMCTMEVSDYPLSHKALDKILSLPIEKSFSLRCLSMKATLYRKEAKMEDALKYLAICREQIGSTEMTPILWRVCYEEAYIARAKGEYEKSISIYDSMIEFDRKEERYGELATSLNLKALTLSEFADPKIAFEMALESLKYAEKSGDQVWIKNGKSLIGKIYLEMGETIKAEPLLREYYQFFDEQNDPMGRGYALYLMGKCEFIRNNFDKLEEILSQAEKDMESISYAEGLGKLYVLQCQIHITNLDKFMFYKNKALVELAKFPYFKTENDLNNLTKLL